MFHKNYEELSRSGKLKRRRLVNKPLQAVNQNIDPYPKESDDRIVNQCCEPDSYVDSSDESAPQVNRLGVLLEHESDPGNVARPNINNFFVNEEPGYDFSFSDSDDLELDSLEEEHTFQNKLREWALRFNISHLALTALLCILKTNRLSSFNLPSDARTLLRTPRTILIEPLAPGHYCHIGLETCLRQLWLRVRENVSQIQLLIGIDGLPLFKSSTWELWPILGLVHNVPSIKSLVFPIGIYCGLKKPSSSNHFLNKFVVEVNRLIENGFSVSGKLLNVSVKGFICDAPAKSFILCTKGHSGYHSCSKCTQEGVWTHNRMTFPEVDARKRTDESFRNNTDTRYHHRTTDLFKIQNLDIIKSFPLDYMHLVCLGVVRTLISLWTLGPYTTKLSPRVISLISSELVNLRKDIPLEFNRKHRSLEDVKRWKATEFRQFLLYTGPIVLKKVFKREDLPLYNNFMSLSISISILTSERFCIEENIIYAESLLKHFISTTKTLYGDQFITHNFHGLVHLADSVRDFGPLDGFSAFVFENFLQFFKKVIRKGDKPLEQVVMRLNEMMHCDQWFSRHSTNLTQSRDHLPVFSKLHNSGPLLASPVKSKQYASVEFANFKIKTTHPNSCCLMKCGSVVLVENIVLSTKCEEMVILCKPFQKKENFYLDHFIESSSLNIFSVSDLSGLIEKPVKDILSKMILLPYYNLQKMDFAIVLFLEEDSAPGIVPTNWIDGTFCYYPNVRMEYSKNRLVMARSIPEKDWMKCPIKVLKEFSSYQLAKSQLSDAEDTSHLESCDDEEGGLSKTRKRKLKLVRLPGEPSSEEEEQEEEEKVEDIRRKQKKPNKVLEYPSPPPSTSSFPGPSNELQKRSDARSLNVGLHLSPGIRTLPPTPLPLDHTLQYSALLSPSSNGSLSSVDRIPEQLHQLRLNQGLMWDILKDNSKLSLRLERIEKKLDALISSKGQLPSSTDPITDVNLNLLSLLPIAELDDFNSLEESLTTNATFRKELARILNTVGGKDLKSLVASLLRKLICDETAEHYTLTGKTRNGPDKISFQKTKSYQLIKEVCFRKFNVDSTENAEGKMRESVSDWLMQAKFRRSRREARMNGGGPNIVEAGQNQGNT